MRTERKKEKIAGQISLSLLAGMFGVIPVAQGAPVVDTSYGVEQNGVVTGGVKIPDAAKVAPAPGTLRDTNITSTTQDNVIAWRDFSVKHGEKVAFDDKNYMNVVTGNATSFIDGTVEGTGKVYIVNPDGVLFGKTANVNVGNLYVSTQDVTKATLEAAKTASNPISAVLPNLQSGKALADVVNLGGIKAQSVTIEGKNVRILDSSKISATKGVIAHVNTGGYVHVGNDTDKSGYTSNTTVDYYDLIKTKGDLQGMVANDATKNYMLADDIDMAGGPFNPIGETEGTPFKGKFDGMFYEIKNLNIAADGSNYRGLFGYTNGARIENVGVVDATIASNTAGGVVGMADNTTIRNVYNEKRSVDPAVKIGVGGSTGEVFAGGIVGYLKGGTTVDSAYNTATVVGSDDGSAGGIVGYIGQGEIKNAYNKSATDNGIYGYAETGVTIQYVYTQHTNPTKTSKIEGIPAPTDKVGVNSWKIKASNPSLMSASTGTGEISAYAAGNYAGWSISNVGGDPSAKWRIYEGQTLPVLTAFLKGTVGVSYDFAYFNTDATGTHAKAETIDTKQYLDTPNTTEAMLDMTGKDKGYLNNNAKDLNLIYNGKVLSAVKKDTLSTEGRGYTGDDVSAVVTGFSGGVTRVGDLKTGTDTAHGSGGTTVYGLRNATGTKALLYTTNQHGYDLVGTNVTIAKRSLGTDTKPFLFSKVYDGKTDALTQLKKALQPGGAAASNISVTGVIDGDFVEIDTRNITKAEFTDPNATAYHIKQQDSHLVDGKYSKITIEGAPTLTKPATGLSDADNYTLDASNWAANAVRATITPREATINMNTREGLDKFYNSSDQLTKAAYKKATNLVIEKEVGTRGVLSGDLGKINIDEGVYGDVVHGGFTGNSHAGDRTVRYGNIRITDPTAQYNYKITGTDVNGTRTLVDYSPATPITQGFLDAKGTIKRRTLNADTFVGTEVTKVYDGTSVYKGATSGTNLTTSVGGNVGQEDDDGVGFVDADKTKILFTTTGTAHFETDAGVVTKDVKSATKAAYDIKVTAAAAEYQPYLSDYEIVKGSGTTQTATTLFDGLTASVRGKGTITPRDIKVKLRTNAGIDKVYDGKATVKDENDEKGYLTFGKSNSYVVYADGTALENKLIDDVFKDPQHPTELTQGDGAKLHVTAVYNSPNVKRAGNNPTGAVEAQDITYTVSIENGGVEDANYKVNTIEADGNLSTGATLAASGTISPRLLTPVIAEETKVYDATRGLKTVPNITVSGNKVGTDDVSIDNTVITGTDGTEHGTFNSPNVKEANTISYKNVVLKGAAAGNYRLVRTGTTTDITAGDTLTGAGKITPLPISLTFDTKPDKKVYNGNTDLKNAASSYISKLQIVSNGEIISGDGGKDGRSSADLMALFTIDGKYKDKKVSERTPKLGKPTEYDYKQDKTLHFTFTKKNDAFFDNYTLNEAAGTATSKDVQNMGTITRRGLIVAPQKRLEKVYDGMAEYTNGDGVIIKGTKVAVFTAMNDDTNGADDALTARLSEELTNNNATTATFASKNANATVSGALKKEAYVVTYHPLLTGQDAEGNNLADNYDFYYEADGDYAKTGKTAKTSFTFTPVTTDINTPSANVVGGIIKQRPIGFDVAKYTREFNNTAHVNIADNTLGVRNPAAIQTKVKAKDAIDTLGKYHFTNLVAGDEDKIRVKRDVITGEFLGSTPEEAKRVGINKQIRYSKVQLENATAEDVTQNYVLWDTTNQREAHDFVINGNEIKRGVYTLAELTGFVKQKRDITKVYDGNDTVVFQPVDGRAGTAKDYFSFQNDVGADWSAYYTIKSAVYTTPAGQASYAGTGKDIRIGGTFMPNENFEIADYANNRGGFTKTFSNANSTFKREITKKTVTVTPKALTKTYNGKTDYTKNDIFTSVDGLVGTDGVTVTRTAVYDDKNVSNTRKVTYTAELAGAAGVNYTLAFAGTDNTKDTAHSTDTKLVFTRGDGVITPRRLRVRLEALTRDYDGTSDADVKNLSVTAIANADDADEGDGKQILTDDLGRDALTELKSATGKVRFAYANMGGTYYDGTAEARDQNLNAANPYTIKLYNAGDKEHPFTEIPDGLISASDPALKQNYRFEADAVGRIRPIHLGTVKLKQEFHKLYDTSDVYNLTNLPTNAGGYVLRAENTAGKTLELPVIVNASRVNYLANAPRNLSASDVGNHKMKFLFTIDNAKGNFLGVGSTFEITDANVNGAPISGIINRRVLTATPVYSDVRKVYDRDAKVLSKGESLITFTPIYEGNEKVADACKEAMRRELAAGNQSTAVYQNGGVDNWDVKGEQGKDVLYSLMLDSARQKNYSYQDAAGVTKDFGTAPLTLLKTRGGTITPKNVTLTFDKYVRTYNGTANVKADGEPTPKVPYARINDVLSGDHLTVNIAADANGVYGTFEGDNGHVGDNKNIIYKDVQLVGTAKGNYSLTYVSGKQYLAEKAGQVTPKQITAGDLEVSFTADSIDKTYDSTDAVLDPMHYVDKVNVRGIDENLKNYFTATGTYASPDSKNETLQDVTYTFKLAGQAAPLPSDYTWGTAFTKLSQPKANAGKIMKRTIAFKVDPSAYADKVTDKMYDGKSDVNGALLKIGSYLTYDWDAMNAANKNAIADANKDGIGDGDAAEAVIGTIGAHYASKFVARDGNKNVITQNINYDPISLTGTKAENYKVIAPTGVTGKITPAKLTADFAYRERDYRKGDTSVDDVTLATVTTKNAVAAAQFAVDKTHDPAFSEDKLKATNKLTGNYMKGDTPDANVNRDTDAARTVLFKAVRYEGLNDALKALYNGTQDSIANNYEFEDNVKFYEVSEEKGKIKPLTIKEIKQIGATARKIYDGTSDARNAVKLELKGVVKNTGALVDLDSLVTEATFFENDDKTARKNAGKGVHYSYKAYIPYDVAHPEVYDNYDFEPADMNKRFAGNGTNGVITPRLIDAHARYTRIDENNPESVAWLSKVYDGTADASLDNLVVHANAKPYSDIILDVDKDKVKLNKVALYRDKNATMKAGEPWTNGKNISYTLTLTGNDEGNYTFNPLAEKGDVEETKELRNAAVGDILKREVKLTLDEISKVYDGTEAAEIAGRLKAEDATTWDVMQKDGVKVKDGYTGSYVGADVLYKDDKIVGRDVKVQNIALADTDGTDDLMNYVFDKEIIAKGKGVITPAELKFEAKDATKVYDGNTNLENPSDLVTLRKMDGTVFDKNGYAVSSATYSTKDASDNEAEESVPRVVTYKVNIKDKNYVITNPSFGTNRNLKAGDMPNFSTEEKGRGTISRVTLTMNGDSLTVDATLPGGQHKPKFTGELAGWIPSYGELDLTDISWGVDGAIDDTKPGEYDVVGFYKGKRVNNTLYGRNYVLKDGKAGRYKRTILKTPADSMAVPDIQARPDDKVYENTSLDTSKNFVRIPEAGYTYKGREDQLGAPAMTEKTLADMAIHGKDKVVSLNGVEELDKAQGFAPANNKLFPGALFQFASDSEANVKEWERLLPEEEAFFAAPTDKKDDASRDKELKELEAKEQKNSAEAEVKMEGAGVNLAG